MPAAGVTLYSRVGCHLCADARAVVETVCAETGSSWTEIDVDSDVALRERFGDHVPVTFVGSQQVAIWFLDPDTLRAALRAG